MNIFKLQEKAFVVLVLIVGIGQLTNQMSSLTTSPNATNGTTSTGLDGNLKDKDDKRPSFNFIFNVKFDLRNRAALRPVAQQEVIPSLWTTYAVVDLTTGQDNLTVVVFDDGDDDRNDDLVNVVHCMPPRHLLTD
jgi:hypothetical protein